MTKEVRIYDGEKSAFSINGVEKTEELRVKESNWLISSHRIQKYTQNGLKI